MAGICKKAEMTNQQIVILVILILSFAIILFFWYQFNWTGEVNEETCHTSVILKKTMPEKWLVGGKVVDLPLRCQTKKICLTSGLFDSGCDEFGGLKNIEKIKVSSEEEIFEVLADSMAGCWSMMGEAKGPMVFTSNWGTLSQDIYGVICSRVAFSGDVKKEFEDTPILLSHFRRYLIQTSYGAGQDQSTYAKFMARNDFTSNGYVAGTGNLDISKEYALIYLEAVPGKLNSYIGLSSGAMLGGIAGSPLGPIGIIAGVAVGGYGGSKVAETGEEIASQKQYESSINLVPYSKENLLKLKTDTFENLA